MRAIDGISGSPVNGAGRGSAHAPWGSFMGKRLFSGPSLPSCLTPSGKERLGASVDTGRLSGRDEKLRDKFDSSHLWPSKDQLRATSSSSSSSSQPGGRQ